MKVVDEMSPLRPPLRQLLKASWLFAWTPVGTLKVLIDTAEFESSFTDVGIRQRKWHDFYENPDRAAENLKRNRRRGHRSPPQKVV